MKYSSHEGRSCLLGIDLGPWRTSVLGAERLGALLQGGKLAEVMAVRKGLADEVADDLHLRLLHTACRDQRRTEPDAARGDRRLLSRGCCSCSP